MRANFQPTSEPSQQGQERPALGVRRQVKAGNFPPERTQFQSYWVAMGVTNLISCMGLSLLTRQADEALVQVNFTPAQTADVFTPLAGEDHRLDDLAIVIVAAGIPQLHQLWLAQVVARALTLTVSAAWADAKGWVFLQIVALNRPSKQPRKRRASAISGNFVLHTIDNGLDVPARDGVDLMFVKRLERRRRKLCNVAVLVLGMVPAW